MIEISVTCPDCRRKVTVSVCDESTAIVSRLRESMVADHRRKGECQANPLFPTETTRFTVKDAATADEVTRYLVNLSRWFSLEPEPFGAFLLQTRPETFPLLREFPGVSLWRKPRA